MSSYPMKRYRTHHEVVVPAPSRWCTAFRQKRWIDVGFFDHCDVVGEAVIFVQEGLDHIVLLAGLDDPVDASRPSSALTTTLVLLVME